MTGFGFRLPSGRPVPRDELGELFASDFVEMEVIVEAQDCAIQRRCGIRKRDVVLSGDVAHDLIEAVDCVAKLFGLQRVPISARCGPRQPVSAGMIRRHGRIPEHRLRYEEQVELTVLGYPNDLDESLPITGQFLLPGDRLLGLLYRSSESHGAEAFSGLVIEEPLLGRDIPGLADQVDGREP